MNLSVLLKIDDVISSSVLKWAELFSFLVSSGQDSVDDVFA